MTTAAPKRDITQLNFKMYAHHCRTEINTPFENGLCPEGDKLCKKYPDKTLLYIAFKYYKEPIAGMAWVCAKYYFSEGGHWNRIMVKCHENKITKYREFVKFIRAYLKEHNVSFTRHPKKGTQP